MKTIKIAGLLVSGMLFNAVATAEESVFTAHISADGKIVQQSPKWIKSVGFKSQPNYFSEYKLTLDPALWKRNPAFCTVSPIDVSTLERQLHGHAKVIGAPRSDNVTVMTQLVDTYGPSGNNDMEFILMCTR